MKKYAILVVLIFLILGQAIAQNKNFEWGLKAGVQLSQFRGDGLVFSANPVVSSSPVRGATTRTAPTVGYAVGVYFRTTENVFLQGEAMLSAKGANINYFNGSTTTTTTVQYTQLDFPLSVGYRQKFWEVSGGPLIAVQLFDNGELKKFLGEVANREPPFKVYVPYTVGYQLGAALRLGSASVGLRYMASIMPVTSQSISYVDPAADPSLRQANFQQRSGVWQLSAAFKIQ